MKYFCYKASAEKPVENVKCKDYSHTKSSRENKPTTVQKREPSYTVVENVNSYSHYGNRMEVA